LHQHLLGEEAITNYAAEITTTLSNLHLDGTKRNEDWNLDRFTQRHMDQHALMDKLVPHGQQPLAESMKIHYFMQGITAPNLQTVKASLSCNSKNTFQETCAAFKTFVTSANNQKPTKQSLNIASVRANTDNKTGNRSRKFTGPTPTSDGYDASKDYSSHKVADRYYAAKEWGALTKGQRNYCRKSNESRKKKGTKRSVSSMDAKTIMDQFAAVMQLHSENQSKKNSVSSSSETETSDDDEQHKRSTKKSETNVITKKR